MGESVRIMSERLVLLRLGESTAGSAGPIPVVLQISTEETRLVELTGQLPPPIALLALYDDWRKLYQSLGLPSRLEVRRDQPTNSNHRDRCIELGRQVNQALNAWLESPEFQRVYQTMLVQLSPTDRVRLLLQITDPALRRLPWQQWNLLDRYPQAELALAMAEYEKGASAAEPGSALRVLAVLGDRRGIDVDVDAAALRALLPGATIEFLVEPDLEGLHGKLWQPWDILFFAGHSASRADLSQGWLSIGPDRRLSLDQLRFGLKRSIAQGLRLAIFNSCDGLGLAQALMDLPIPQVVVMREEVSDPVAQKFLTYFLGAIAEGKPVDLAVREGRERLQGLDDYFPGAAWLPILCQNPAEPSWSLPRIGESSQSIAAQTLSTGAIPVSSIPTGLISPNSIPASLIPASSIPTSSIPTNSIPTSSSPTSSIPTDSSSTDLIPIQPNRLSRFLTATIAAALTATLATLTTIGLRATGWLEPLELLGLDTLIQYQPAEAPDRRILIIGIDDADLNRQGQGGSLSDANLMRLLDRLDQAPPRIIGLDIYRPIAADPKVKGLGQRLGNQANLVFVCKTNDAEVVGLGPPPEVPPDLRSAQVGFSDFIADRDGVLRRQILFQTPSVASQCTTPYSFSTQLAAHYLDQEDVAIGFSPRQDLQFVPVAKSGGKAQPIVLQRLASRAGGYQGIEAGGSQILIHYRQAAFDQVSLAQVLSGQISPDAWRDRAVLIGVTAQSASDRWVTPFGRSQPDQRPGVQVQAHLTSQLLSAVLDRRSLIRPSDWGYDGLWVWLWAFGAGLSRWVGARWRGIGLMLLALGLSLGCWIALGQGVWLPWVPGLGAIAVGAGFGSRLGRSIDLRLGKKAFLDR
jgi:CHASE2 domain-containing sensor protein